MKEKEFYRSVFNRTLLNKTEAKERIDAQTRAVSVVERKHIHLSRRAMIAIAVAASLLIVGSAAAATSVFVRSNYIPYQYLNQDAEQRRSNGETIAELEQTLSAARPTDVSYTVRMMPEIDVDGTIARWRDYMGQPPYKEEDWAWIRELKPTVGDVLFDGSVLYVTTYIETDRPEIFDLNAETEQRLWIASEEADYTVNGESTTQTIPLHGENNWGESSDHSVKVVAMGEPEEGVFPEEGTVTMTQHLYVADAKTDDMQPARATIAIIDFTFTFDAAAGRPAAPETHVSIPLSGEHTVSMREWERYETFEDVIRNMVIRNQPLSLDGVVLDAKIEYRPVGVYVTLTIRDTPESWTEYEKRSLITALGDAIGTDADLTYRINGEAAQKPERLNYGDGNAVRVLLPVYPSDYGSVTSLTLDVMLHRIVSANGEQPRDDWSWDYEKQGEYDSLETAAEPLAVLEIPIPKNR